MSDTTPFVANAKTKPLQKIFEKQLEWIGKKPSCFHLTTQQYTDWMDSISEYNKKYLNGNPVYKGVEIKRMGDN